MLFPNKPVSRAEATEAGETDSADSSFEAEASKKIENIAPEEPPISFSETDPIVLENNISV